ncbi:demethylmenaquinone methyltransferase [Mycetocola zhujimingii]|uniref:Demethylmenaquinone methyltransferase n=1 Tax=Mycetocola zhujimingii TaxID=2079792 RepID=A0A2U1TAA1_9MICO|nr:demethylmenaquinone methyltransferase [Mycetocola zhujimingii]AWB85480.1 bifunctional demethylmenaquinone methyltransferase/2-methoxy-6-polyprenyl-1,4-benzoquinol methylase [Mycetocola zhujimingii]PWC04611.1 demethylmenaquinone methyltransferase [Mycetocola zhujimingii]
MNKADLSKQPSQVSAMFDQVSTHYDRTNAVMSVGNDMLWRVATTRAVDPHPGDRILDLAAGTGTSSASLAKSGATVVAADFSPGMIEVGRKKYGRVRNMQFVEADATDLPFGDNEFDATTISFGLRNVVEPKKAIAEMFRVTKPGGRIVICEFSTPPNPVMKGLYDFYLERVTPVMVKLSSSNPDAYDYLNDSIKAWPKQAELASWLRGAGWTEVQYRNLTGGIVALHRGTKPVA